MTITEFAILPVILSDNSLPSSLIKILKDEVPTVEAWKSAHHPDPAFPPPQGNPPPPIWRQVEDSSKLLLSMQWASLDAHWSWIAGEANQRIMDRVKQYLAAEDDANGAKIDLFHLDSAIFAGPSPPEAIALTESPVISIARMTVDPHQKEAFQAKWDEVQQLLIDFSSPHTVKGAWRVDPEEGKAQFVVVSGWTCVERHLEFGKTDEFAKFRDIRNFTTGFHVNHYTPISDDGST